jgi:MFS family permease
MRTQPVTATQHLPASARRLAFAGWLFCSLFFFYAFVLRVSPSVMVDDLMRDFAVGGAVLGNLSAFYFYSYAGLQIPVGVLIDRLGLRLVAGACAVSAAGTVLFALAPDLGTAYAGRTLIGVGAAFSFVAALHMAGTWFPERFAVLGGFAQMLGVGGAIAGQAPLGLAIEAWGWREANLGIGAIGLALAVAIALTVRDRPATTAATTAARPTLLAGLKVAAANPQTWYAAGACGALTGAMLAFGGLWGVPYLIAARGLSKPEAAGLVSLLFVGWAVTAPTIGFLSDRLRRRKPFILGGSILATVFMAVLVAFPTLPYPVLVPVMLLQGGGACSMILCFAIAREHNPASISGATLGIINTFAVGSGALLQPLVGWLLDRGWDGTEESGARLYAVATHQSAMLVLPLTCGIAIVLALAMRETAARQRV